MENNNFKFKDYLRLSKMPHIWCPGCGHGIVLQGMLRGIHSLGLDKNKITITSGIGCSSRAVGYVDFNTVHTAHGRSLPFATGIKLAKPELTVIALGGDGDMAAIGGNHLIHAARRNIDITVIVFNNSIYGMTSGQFSPLTPSCARTTTSPHGNIERNFDICDLAIGSGATYVARSTAYHAVQIPRLVAKDKTNKGFSLVEVITQCPVYFGKMNLMHSTIDMLRWQRDHTMNLKQASLMSEKEKKGKYVIGELYNKPCEELTEKYARISKEAKEK